jgi:hypothetical protein
VRRVVNLAGDVGTRPALPGRRRDRRIHREAAAAAWRRAGRHARRVAWFRGVGSRASRHALNETASAQQRRDWARASPLIFGSGGLEETGHRRWRFALRVDASEIISEHRVSRIGEATSFQIRGRCRQVAAPRTRSKQEHQPLGLPQSSRPRSSGGQRCGNQCQSVHGRRCRT